MRIKDWLKATQNKWPYQAMSVKPVTHYDDLEEDNSNDFVVTMIVANKQVAYRVDLETALSIDAHINRALQLAVKGVSVSIYTGKEESEKLVGK